MGWCACCATSGRCRASSGGGVGGWSASASPPFTRSQPRSRKAFPPCFVAVCGWVVCAKNWQLRHKRHHLASRQALTENDLASFVHADEVKDALCEIDAYDAQLGFHGSPLLCLHGCLSHCVNHCGSAKPIRIGAGAFH